ncbi:MAG: helix-turn-helix transcriptional regulator [Clostridia bacterium]|nr:helix-turn-helix transcriptional regulator [Clostridia bacterium]
MIFEEKLMKLRKMNGLSQEDLANKINVSRQVVSKWELGQSKPNMNNLIQISKLFNINIEMLTNDDFDVDSKYSSEAISELDDSNKENKITFDDEKSENDSTYKNLKEASSEFDKSESNNDEEFNQRKYGNYNNQSNTKKSKSGIVILIILMIVIIALVGRLVITFIDYTKEKKEKQEQQQSVGALNQQNKDSIKELNQEQEENLNTIKNEMEQKESESKKSEEELSHNQETTNNNATESNESFVSEQNTTNNQNTSSNMNNEGNQTTTNNHNSDNNGISEVEIMQFNGFIEMRKGTQDKFFITGLLDEIISSNQKNPNRIVVLEYNETTTSDADEIRNIKYNLASGKYDVILEYDNVGFINKVILRKI